MKSNLEKLLSHKTIYIHYEIVPYSSPPFLACLYVGGVVVRPHISGFPSTLRALLTSEKKKVVSHGRFVEALQGQYLWGVEIPNVEMMKPQYYADSHKYFWGDATYPEGAMEYLDMRVAELRSWDLGEGVTFHPFPEDDVSGVERIEIVPDERNDVASLSICRVQHNRKRPFYPVNLMNANLITYLQEYTFTPPDKVYYDWVRSCHYTSAKSINETVLFQDKNHERMLGRGSTQINTCTNAITVGSFVRVDSRAIGKEDYTADPNGDSVNGTVPWTDKIYKVREIIEGTDVSPRKYALVDLTGTLYRSSLCPIENLEIGAIVRIRLSTIAKWLMANGTVKVREKHFAYNHTYSRALFRIAEQRDIPDEGRKYFLELEWSPVGTFKYSEWEVDEGRNLWSLEHHERGLSLGVKPFTGFHTYDLLRVDQQTEILMKTEEGKEKYRECLLKCMNAGHKASYMDTVDRKRVKKDPIVASRTKEWKASYSKNETLRETLLGGLPKMVHIFQPVVE
jgi:hypothetical protein